MNCAHCDYVFGRARVLKTGCCSFFTEAYRSGHNEAVLKTVWEQSHGGSNPSASAKKKPKKSIMTFWAFCPFWHFSRFFKVFGLKIGLQISINAVPKPNFFIFRAKNLVYFLRFFTDAKNSKKGQSGWIRTLKTTFLCRFSQTSENANIRES